MYELDRAYILSAPELASQACLKKTGVKLELLIDNNMLLIVEKRIREVITHSIHRYAEANNKYVKDYNKNIKSSYLMYLDAKNLYGWEMSENCLWMVLNGEKYTKMQLIFYKKL